MDATYISSTSFSVVGDYTSWFMRGSAVKITQTAGNAVSRVQSSSYSAGWTTVVIEEAVIVVSITSVDTGPAIGPNNSFPYHSHSRLEGHGGALGCNAIQRMEMTYKDADEVYINPGAYYIQNNANDPGLTFWCNAILTFAFSGLGASENQYVYADYSAIIAKDFGEVDASCFFNSNSAPTWDDDRQGWYSTDDLCIWGIPTNAASAIYPFQQVGDEVIYFEFESTWDIANGDDIDTSWVPYTADIPAFSRMARFLVLWGSATTADSSFLLTQPTGFVTSENQAIVFIDVNTNFESVLTWIATDASQSFGLLASASNTNKVYLQSHGFKLGRGM